MVIERIVGEAETRIKISIRRVILKDIRHGGERGSVQVVRDGVQRVLVGSRVGDEFVPQADIKGQAFVDLPIVLSITGEIDFAKVAVAVTQAGQGSEEEERPVV